MKTVVVLVLIFTLSSLAFSKESKQQKKVLLHKTKKVTIWAVCKGGYYVPYWKGKEDMSSIYLLKPGTNDIWTCE